MTKTGRSYFVRNPREIGDLRAPHLIEREQPYEIVTTVTLSGIDYENFITDMFADRRFLEENAPFCSSGATMRCLLVRPRGKDNGVLVVPDGAFVALAALYLG